jgi:hypothetical protein
MANPPDDLPLGGEVPPGGPLGSLELDERAMKKGKGRMVAGMVLAGVGAVVALAFYLAAGGESPYAGFGRSVNGLHQQHFEAFWGCVMQGHDMRRVKNDQDLRQQLHERAGRGRARFAAHVRDDCLPKLADLEPGLAALVPPDDVAQPVRDMLDAVSRLRGGFSDYIAHLDGLDKEQPYVPEDAEDPMGRITRAWYDYKVAFGGLNKHLKEKLGR